MRKIVTLCTLLLFVPAFAHKGVAQEAPKSEAHYYHLDFVVQEVGEDGKPTNSRSYSTTVATDSHEASQIRNGTRIPIITGTDKTTTQFQYVDIGVNIDARNAHEIARQLAVAITAEISSLATPTGLSAPGDPVIHQNKWSATVLIPIGKSTVVFNSDNLENKGRMQLTVTATPLQ